MKERGQSLIKYGKEWEWIKNKKVDFNKKENKIVKVFQETIHGWEIGLACDALEKVLPIICFDNT